MTSEDKISKFRATYDALTAEIGKVIVGQKTIVNGTVLSNKASNQWKL